MIPATSIRRAQFSRVPSLLAELGLRGLTVVTDMLHPRLRFGRWNSLLSGLAFARGLPVVEPQDGLWQQEPTPGSVTEPDMSCLIIAGALDTGGVESVVATLALGLPAHRIDVEVVCSEEGRMSEWLAEREVRVTRVPNADLADFTRSRQPDAIQLHRVDRTVLDALSPYASRTVPVFHAMEAYLDAATWAALAAFTRYTTACIAVSRSVADFFDSRIGSTAEVVVNGVPDPIGDLRDRHDAERLRLSAALGVALTPEDIVVVALQRFSDQKNAAGLVDAFLLAAESNPDLRLVVAGAPNSWLEVRRADILRRLHPRGARVHLLGDSDPAALLVGGDLFALDSFAEGGPVSAVEAVACGLPVVLSDVGFARQLVASTEVPGRVVARANSTMGQSALARERRKRHQSNRRQFAQALLEMARETPRLVTGVPTAFSKKVMVSGHAELLRRAATTSDRARRG